MLTEYIKKILEARVYDVAIETPIETMGFLSEHLKNNIMVKREDLQPVYSFKLRGAYNKIDKLSKDELSKGIIAASAGNHAQGVALSASRKGIKSIIVMPKTTPNIKVESVKKLGSEVILYGDTFNEAYEYAVSLKDKHDYTFIHPYDDPDVIAGQGTIGMEIIRQYSQPIDAIFIPVGGGGLIAGISAYIKYLRPQIKIIGVEAEDSACLKAAINANERVVLPHVGIFADGVAVKQIGKTPFEIAKNCVDDVITVNIDQICAAIKDIYTDIRAIAEPAGALAVAGLKKYIEENKICDNNLLAVISGANVNFDRLRHVSERSEIGEKREAIFAVTIPEKPGSFRKFCQVLNQRSITEFNYRYSDTNDAKVFVGIRLASNESRENIAVQLNNNGYCVTDLSDNELAKLHIRHMVGGKKTLPTEEQVYRVQFPERPGALLQFLNAVKPEWNITMFHYRNHGAAFGRVFLALQLPKNEKTDVSKFLSDLKYTYIEENNNPAYKLFLS